MDLKARTKTMARRFGFELRRFDPKHSAAARRLTAIERAAVDLVVDVGANVGQYAFGLRQSGYAGRIVSFEPLSAAYSELSRRASRDPLWTTRRVALGSEAGVAEMSVSKNSVSSSFLTATAAHVNSEPGAAAAQTEEVRIERLDAVLADRLAATERGLLKLDLQGYELEALEGAGAMLERFAVVEVELSLAAMYHDEPLLPEVSARIMELGFRCVGFEPAHSEPATGFVLQVDGLFIRDEATSSS